MNIKAHKENIRGRIKARQNAVQALYQWFITNKNVNEVIAEFENDKHKLAKTDINYFKSLLRGTITNHEFCILVVTNWNIMMISHGGLWSMSLLSLQKYLVRKIHTNILTVYSTRSLKSYVTMKLKI